MLILALTTDKLQLVTGSTSALSVHASWANNASGTITNGKQNTAISSAATTDVVAAPGSGVTTVQLITIVNTGAASNTISVLYNANGTTYTLYAVTMNPGDVVQYVDGWGWAKIPNSFYPMVSASTATQALGTGETYVTGSSITFPATRPPQIGTHVRFTFYVTKTAASTATATIQIKWGTAGTTGDTSIQTFSLGAQTAVADTGFVQIDVTFNGPLSASCIIHGSLAAQHSTAAATGLFGSISPTLDGTSSAFNCTTANGILGLSITAGSGSAWTIDQMEVQVFGN